MALATAPSTRRERGERSWLRYIRKFRQRDERLRWTTAHANAKHQRHFFRRWNVRCAINRER